MTESKGWNWSIVQGKSAEQWKIPAVESIWLAERWKQLGEKDILDLGCGLGRHSVLFAKYGFDVHSMDISEEALDRTREWAENEGLTLEYTHGDMLSLPYDNDSMDCVYSRNVMNHTDTAGLYKAIGEITRVLRHGGEVFLTLASQSNDAYINGTPETKIDENTYACTAEGPEFGVPHVYVDHKLVRDLFSDYDFIWEYHIEEFSETVKRADGSEFSYFHYHILARKK